jgi:oxygen-dependent protoporphyrinogen oxidase
MSLEKSSTTNDFDCIVIGGGISGLSAAWKLQQRGFKSAVIEASDPGGVLQTFRRDGYQLEGAANVFLLKPELQSMIVELGLMKDVRRPAVSRYKQYVWYDGAPTRVPKSPFVLLSTPLIRGKDKIRLIRSIFSGKHLRPAAEDESVATFFQRLIGEYGVSHLLNPALQGIFGGDVSALSARSLFPGLWAHCASGKGLRELKRTGVRPETVVLRGGMGQLVNTLAKRLLDGALIRSSAKSIEKLPSGDYRVTLDDGQEVQAPAVICATSGSATQNYLHKLAGRSAEFLTSLRYAPITVVHVAVDSLPTKYRDAFGVLYPAGHKSGLLGVMFNSILFPHLAPPDRQLLTICMGGVFRPDLTELAEAELIEKAICGVESTLGFQHLEALNVTNWEKAIPQYMLGHMEYEAQLSNLTTEFPGLFFCGADSGGIGVPDRVTCATKVADSSIEFLQQANHSQKTCKARLAASS